MSKDTRTQPAQPQQPATPPVAGGPLATNPDVAELQARLTRLEAVNDFLTQKQQTEQEYAKWKEWAALPAEKKTQLVADKLWPAGGENDLTWSVSLIGHPTVKVNAPTAEVAQARYDKLCTTRIMNAEISHTVQRLAAA